MSNQLQTQIQLSARLYGCQTTDVNVDNLESLELDVLEHLGIDEQTVPPFLNDLEETLLLIPEGWKLTQLREGTYTDKDGRTEMICFLAREDGTLVAKGNALSEEAAVTVSILKAVSIDNMTANDSTYSHH